MTKKSRENEEGQMNQFLTLDFARKNSRENGGGQIQIIWQEISQSLDFVIQFTILPKNSRQNGGGQIFFILLLDH